MGALISYNKDTPEGKKRQELIEQVLPKKPLVPEDVADDILKAKREELTALLIQEIEIYKAFPREGEYKPDKFNPRNSRMCFMGQGFKANGRGFEGWTDFDLHQYRKAVGTIPHTEWGDCTLLEIWAADHFADYKTMVKGVFLYCNGDRKTMPKVTFYINPFYKNNKSGKWDPHDDETADQANREHLIKIAHYVEIRSRMKKAKVKSPIELAIREEDDPKPRRR
jgi:hypothetical protein